MADPPLSRSGLFLSRIQKILRQSATLGGTGRGDYTSLIEAFKDVVAGAAILRPAGGTDPVYCIGEDSTAAADAADAQAVDDQFSAAELGELVAWPDAKMERVFAARLPDGVVLFVGLESDPEVTIDQIQIALDALLARGELSNLRQSLASGPRPGRPRFFRKRDSRVVRSAETKPRLRRLPFEWEALSIFRRPSRFWRTPLGNCWRSRP